MIGAVQFLKKTNGIDQKFTAQITLFRKNECNMLSKAYFDHEIAFKNGRFECWKRSFFRLCLQNEVISGKLEKNAFKKTDFEWKWAEKRKFSQCEYLSHCENKIEYMKRVQKKIVASLDFVGTKSVWIYIFWPFAFRYSVVNIADQIWSWKYFVYKKQNFKKNKYQ